MWMSASWHYVARELVPQACPLAGLESEFPLSVWSQKVKLKINFRESQVGNASEVTSSHTPSPKELLALVPADSHRRTPTDCRAHPNFG